MKQSTNRDELPLYKQILLGIVLSASIVSSVPQTYKSLNEILSDRIKPQKSIEKTISYEPTPYQPACSKNDYKYYPELCQ